MEKKNEILAYVGKGLTVGLLSIFAFMLTTPKETTK